MDNIEKVQKAGELAQKYKKEGYHCSESIIRAVPEALGIKISDETIKAACGFFGGGGGTGDRCGVIESTFMLISILYGRMDANVSDQDIRDLAAELNKRFTEHFGSIYCRDIKPKEVEKYGADFGCMRVYEEGAKLVAQLLLDADKILGK